MSGDYFYSALDLNKRESPLDISSTTGRRAANRGSLETIEGTPIEEQEEIKEEDLPVISLTEVAEHRSLDSAWMVIYDKVYDITEMLSEVRKVTAVQKYIPFFITESLLYYCNAICKSNLIKTI